MWWRDGTKIVIDSPSEFLFEDAESEIELGSLGRVKMIGVLVKNPISFVIFILLIVTFNIHSLL